MSAELRDRRLHRLARPAFVLYALALFVATHWPKLQVPGAEVRSDLIIHLLVFAGWSFLLGASGLLGPWRAPRSVGLAVLVGLAYAAADEGSQAIPALGRVCAWDDLMANWTGVVSGGLALLIGARVLPGGRSIPASASRADRSTG